MLSFLLPVFLPSLASALPAPAPAAQAQPTLFTFTYEGRPVTATYFGTGTQPAAACPTQTFTYNGAAITIPYTGPGTPQSCLTPAAGNVATVAPPAGTPVAPSSPQTMPAAPVAPAVTPAAPAVTTPASTPSSTPSAGVLKGFNYGSTGANGAALSQADFETSFNTAKNLVGATGFTSARLYTMIAAGTTNTPIAAIPAAISTGTKLLLGLWASGGQTGIDNEIAALKNAISQYGTQFANQVVGISVGSEDLYRVSPIGLANDPNGVGANAATLVSYINQVRAALKGTILEGKPILHVDTFNVITLPENAPVVAAVDIVGMDAYPYFQTTFQNSIENSANLFQSAYQQVVALGKPVWVTETGFPVSGPTSNLAIPSTANAKTYWDTVGCTQLFDKVNTFWYTLNDAGASPSFGVSNGAPTFDLSCPAA